MSHAILIPVYLDALFLAHDQLIAGPKADFTRLPYLRNEQDIHPDIPFLSEEILSHPFYNENLHLKAGVHLHWALPDAMTKTLDGADSSSFPVVPNRWLITRWRGGQKERSWIVESDYLYPAGKGSLSGSISYPFPKQHPDDPPFRFMGRDMAFAAWRNNQGSDEYLGELTAVGYGEPTFAAFYPNCHSVFGFHDGEIDQSKLPNITYEVAGWYSDPDQDFLKQVQRHLNAPTLFDWHDAVEKALMWNIEVRIDKAAFLQGDPSASTLWQEWVNNNWIATIDDQTARLVPKSQWNSQGDERALSFMNRLLGPFLDLQTLCFSRLTFPAEMGEPLENPALQDAETSITVANTGTEALSAYLARQLEGAFPAGQIEDQLEAIQLAEKLEHRQLDLGPKFEEARHQKSFNAVPGGTRWMIRAKNDPASVSKADNVAAQQEVTLPEAFGHALNQLNLLQYRYDQAREDILSLKHQLFSDWCQYLRCTYPPDGTHEAYIDPDEVKYYIEQKSLPQLSGKEKVTGKASWDEDSEKRVFGAVVSEGEANSLAEQLATAINGLIEQLKAFNRQSGLLLALKLGDKAPDGSVRDFSGHEKKGQLNGSMAIIDDNEFQQVAVSDGTDGQLLLPELQDVRAISFWSFIPTGNEGCIIDTDTHPTAIWSSQSVGTAWAKLYVDGQQATAMNWDAIPKDKWVHLYLEFKQAFSGQIYMLSRSSGQEFLGGKLAHVHVYDKTLDEAEILQDRNQFVCVQYVLQTSVATRFWQAKEPVALISGKVVELSRRHGADGQHREDGKLHCISWPNRDVQGLLDENFGEFSPHLNAIRDQYPADHFAFRTWPYQPWNPLLLEWQAIMAPLKNKSNLREELREYHPDFITENYQMLENAVDLEVRQGRFSIVNLAYEYSGSSILTPFADFQLTEKLESYLKKQALIPWYASKKTPQEDQVFDFTSQKVKEVLDAFVRENSAAGSEGPMINLINAYKLISNDDFHCLSQAFGGFNDALLMHHLVLQTPVEDPLGFPEYQDFARKVANALGSDIRSGPHPENDFNPIRSGVMRINQLRLIDSFGRSRPLYAGTLNKPHQMQVPGRPDMVHLRPRLVQPARLNFRWLSATDGDQEMNDHPATSPLCGWIVANHLDHSLMIYHADGRPLCSMNPSGDSNFILRHPPGPDFGRPFDPQEIDNIYLRKMAAYLLDRQQKNRQFLQHFITVINSSLANIDPENYAQHAGISLLMSRPVALARASLNLEIRGLPAINHDWNVLRLDLLRNYRQTEEFSQVEFPIRLGEHKQLNDGLVGYWLEEEGSYKGQQFFAPQSEEVADESIITRSGSRFTLCQSLSGAPHTLSLLLDPRGVVHATSGIIPVKTINIPPDQYAEALRRIQVTFLSTPLISDSQQVQLPLPDATGSQWSWLANTEGGWDEISVPGTVRKLSFTKVFGQEAEAIWTMLNQENVGWVKALDADRASVIAVDKRPVQQLPGQWAARQVQIEAVLARANLGQAPTQATLHGSNLIREGWLKLKNEPE